MNKSTILNKLKLLDIRNPWQVSVVHELSNRQGASARIEPLMRAVTKRLKANQDPKAKLKFDKAISSLLQHGFLFKKTTDVGKRLHLFRDVWQLEDAIIESVSTSTMRLTTDRRLSIQWRTILKEVRKDLATHKVILKPKISKVLVCYFLLRRCKWRLNDDKELMPPKTSRRKLTNSPEQQQDLFS